MGAILVRVANANRQPVLDRMDVVVIAAQTKAEVAHLRNVSGGAALKITGLVEREPYIVQVFPTRHRPVGGTTLAGTDADPKLLEMHAPLDPDQVRVTFPAYADLHAELTRVLERSVIDSAEGEALYARLAETQKAGLLNLFSKMSGCRFDESRTVWTFVDRLYAVGPDRIFVDVKEQLLEVVRAAVVSKKFREAPGRLHEPPPAYCRAGSFKTCEKYGNLQLTFFCAERPPLAYKVDADIDDAAGLAHAFQVLRNWATRGTTHPYDIHQILVFDRLTVPYDLA